MRIQTRADPTRFFDGGVPAWLGLPEIPPDRSSPPRIVLDRLEDDRGRESFELLRRIAYADARLGTVIAVPARPWDFRTDLTSTPRWFTWLVPKSGRHLPAALVHDALVGGGDEASYTTEPPVRIDRVEADRVFRDAMRDTGTGVVRRWLAWAAVTAVSLVVAGRPHWSPWVRWWFRLVVPGTFALIVYLGACATVMLLGREWPGFVTLPWMDHPDGWRQVLGGLSGAIVVPLLLGVLWGPYQRVAAVAGVAVATLLHVTLAVGVVAVAYQAVEWVAMRWPGVAATATAVALAASLVGFALAVW
jgi:hypothetical protein